MEKLKYFLVAVVFLYNINITAADPTFDLRLTNRNYISSNEGYFDVVIKHTNPGQSDFKYAGGEYVIILNSDFQTEHLNYTYSIDTATYGRERIPQKYVGSLMKNLDTLKLTQGDTIQTGNEPVISTASGTLVARIRFFNPDLYSNTCLMEEQFEWKKYSPGVSTKIYFRNNGVTNLINNSFSSFSTYDLCVSSFCCLEAPLHPPVRTSPENNSENLSAPVTLQWQRGFPVNYSARLQVAADSAFSDIVLDSSFSLPNGNENVSVILSSVTHPGEYYWRVKQGGIPPQGAYNEAWKFTIRPGSVSLKLTVIPEGLYRYGNFGHDLMVYLRNIITPFEIKDSCSVISTDSSYQNILNFNNAVSGMYFIEVNIPGCIATWSKEGGVYLSRELTINEYDFSSYREQSYSGNVIFVNNRYCLFSGDVNQDCIIDLNDIIILYYNALGFVKWDVYSDLNGDGVSDLSDILISGNNSNNFVYSRSPVPSTQNMVSSGNQMLNSP